MPEVEGLGSLVVAWRAALPLLFDSDFCDFMTEERNQELAWQEKILKVKVVIGSKPKENMSDFKVLEREMYVEQFKLIYFREGC